jgi:hypothetical protein
MKPSLANIARRSIKLPATERAGIRLPLLLVTFFLLGVGVSALWFYRNPKRSVSNEVEGIQTSSLSDRTKAVLAELRAPVEIRFYSLLDPGSVPVSLRDFASRVAQLLSEYQQAAKGMISVVRYDSVADTTAADAASADGLKPLNLDKGEACYLGLTVAQNGRKETLQLLSPDWEPALESDLTRAILRVVKAKSPEKNPTPVVQLNAASIAEVKRAIPNLASVSVEQGTQILREAGVKELKAAADEMESQIKKAQDRLTQAQKGGSEAELAAARKQLMELQTEQVERLKEIAARLETQISVLRQLKKE